MGSADKTDALSVSAISAISSVSSLSPTCRICFQDIEDSGNPLISPCRCSGSIGFVHRKCLRKWIEVNFALDFPKCEICNFPYKRGGHFNFKQLSLPSCSSESMHEDDGDGNGNLLNEILCFASVIIIFIALFAAIVTQTITSFSLPQVCDAP